MSNLDRITRGDDVSFISSFFEDDGSPKDITGWTIFFTVKTKKDYFSSTDDTNAVISKTITSHTDAVGGKTAITLSNADTDVTPDQYYYDIQYLDGSGKVKTVKGAPFLFTVIGDVTRRTS